MIIATLCTTYGSEPWAANVPFELDGNVLKTSLKTKYAHFQNLLLNKNTVIVFKNKHVELIMKATAKVDEKATETSEGLFTVTWLRVVNDDGVNDYEETVQISDQLGSNISDI